MGYVDIDVVSNETGEVLYTVLNTDEKFSIGRIRKIWLVNRIERIGNAITVYVHE